MMDSRGWNPLPQWKPLAGVELKAPGDLAILSDGTLLVADGSDLVVLEVVDGERLVETRRRAGRSTNLRLAADSGHVLLSDAENHRVLLLNENLEVLSAFGEAGVPGAGTNHLDGPAGVAIVGDRAVVADANNQRIVKLLIK